MHASRQQRASFPTKSENKANQPLKLVHSDLVGPLPKPSLHGSRYIYLFTDNYTRKSWIYILRAKSETFDKFRIFRKRVEKETGKRNYDVTN